MQQALLHYCQIFFRSYFLFLHLNFFRQLKHIPHTCCQFIYKSKEIRDECCWKHVAKQSHILPCNKDRSKTSIRHHFGSASLLHLMYFPMIRTFITELVEGTSTNSVHNNITWHLRWRFLYSLMSRIKRLLKYKHM